MRLPKEESSVYFYRSNKFMSHCLHLSNLYPKITKDWPAFMLHVQVILSMVSAQRWVNLTKIFCVTEE